MLCALIIELDETFCLRNLRQVDFGVASLVNGELTDRSTVCITDGDGAIADGGLVIEVVVVAATSQLIGEVLIVTAKQSGLLVRSS